MPQAASRWNALTRPLRNWSTRARWAALVAAVLLGAGVSLAVVPLSDAFRTPDSAAYLKIAEGRTDEVQQPFASRQLGPRVAYGLAALAGRPVRWGFEAEGLISLAFAMGVTCWFVLHTRAPGWMLLALVLVPSWPLFVRCMVLPDLWYAALLAVLFLLLAAERYLLAALMMFPLMLSRESTSLTLLCFLTAAWPKLRWRDRAAAVLAAAAASLAVARLDAGSQPNVEHLPQAIYLFAKLPWNLMRNVIGVLPWSDANPELCRVPVWSMPVHLGPVHAVGVCGFSLIQQLLVVEGTLTNFGLLPLLVAVLWWRQRHLPGGVQGRSTLLRFALLYGGVSYLLAPVLGAGFVHLMQYAWPLFLIALPQLFNELPAVTLSTSQQAAALGFFGLHLVAGAISYWPVFLPMIGAGLLLWVAGYLLLRWWLGSGKEAAPEALDSAPI